MNRDAEILEPSHRARWLLLLFLLLVLVPGVLLYRQLVAIELPPDATLEQLETISAEFRRLIRYATLGNFVIGLALSAYFLRLGYRAWKFAEFPPPQCAVVVRTRVVTGSPARSRAVLCYILALLAWAGFASALYLEFLLNEFT